jgi:hypothetical protein
VVLADVGDVHRFGNRDRFASWNGTAPLDASSGEQQRHHLSGPVIAGSSGHCTSWESSSSVIPPPAASISTRRRRLAIPRWKRCALKRRLSNVVYARMRVDQKRREAAGPGGHPRTTLQFRVTRLTPDTGPSDKPQPEPAAVQPKPITAAPWRKGEPTFLVACSLSQVPRQ